jgi:hypothetical protein
MTGDVRECRLRPEYEHLYEEIPPGVWMPAHEVARALIQRLNFDPRGHDPLHFDFRGGEASEDRSAGRRTRQDD